MVVEGKERVLKIYQLIVTIRVFLYFLSYLTKVCAKIESQIAQCHTVFIWKD